MNRTIVKKSIVGITLAILLLNLSIPIYSQDSSHGKYTLHHSVSVTENGFLSVEELVDFVNTESSVVTLQQFDITYASISIDSISSITTQGPIDFSIKKSSIDNDTVITINPIEDYRVNSGDNITIGLQFFVSNQVNVTDRTNYSVKLPLVPSMNRNIDEIKTNVYLPPGSTIVHMPR